MYASSQEREGRKKRRMRRKGRKRREGKEKSGERSEEVKQESERWSTKVNRVEGSERERERDSAQKEERITMATVDALGCISTREASGRLRTAEGGKKEQKENDRF